MAGEHDITPACFGILGRRGDTAAMTKAKKLMGGHPTPWNTKTSDNIRCIQAVCNAVVWRDYENAEKWFERAREVGIGEGGGLYWPAGDVGYAIALTLSALDDGHDNLYQQGREYLSWCVDLMRRIVVPRRPSAIIGIGRDGKEYPGEGSIRGGPEGHVYMPGPRAAFGSVRPGWYLEGPATNVYQWLAGVPHREINPRYANYAPGGPTWDSWPWLVAQLRRLTPASRDPKPTLLSRVFRRSDLTDLIAGVEPGPYKLRYGLNIVRSDFWMMVAASHPTSGPKPPATWIEWTKGNGRVRIAYPDGYRNYGNRGRGTIEWTRDEVWAEGESEGVILKSKRRERSQVREHWVLAPRATGWKEGALHPRQPAPVPPPPAPPPGEDEDRNIFDRIGDALSRLWQWLEARF